VDPDRYVERARRRRHVTRVAPVAVGLALAGGVVGLSIWGDDWACHYSISRENYGVPDLTGLPLHEAREKLPSCVDVVPSDRALAEDPDARIVDQEPRPPDVLNERRSVEVVIAPASHEP
jgi:hypothetical protein